LLKDLCPNFVKEIESAKELNHYLALEKGQFFDVDFSTLELDKKLMQIRHEEEDANLLKK